MTSIFFHFLIAKNIPTKEGIDANKTNPQYSNLLAKEILPETNFIHTKVSCFKVAPPATVFQLGSVVISHLPPASCVVKIGSQSIPNKIIGVKHNISFIKNFLFT